MTTTLNQIATWTNDLAIAVKALGDQGYDHNLDQLADAESYRARRSILSIATRIKTHLAEPTDFVQQLATQIQLLACLRWLGEFQVLACIPLTGTISMKDVADLAVVPESQLRRVIRMTATVGFLREPSVGQIAHTPLSASFVTNLSFLDATMFLAETSAPAALHMATSTLRNEPQEELGDSAYSIAFKSSQSFESACAERTRLQRQWSAYRRCVGDFEDHLPGILGRLNWRSLGNACIVDVSAQSTEAATTLAENHTSLQFMVQLVASGTADDDIRNTSSIPEYVHPRVVVQSRSPAAPQTVKDGAVYILRLPPLTASSAAHITAELHAHLPVLRDNLSATLLLAPPILPEPGSVEAERETMARLSDLSRLQLCNQPAFELDVLVEMIQSVRDASGGLVVVTKLRSCDNATAALAVRYQACGGIVERREGYVEEQTA
ncbi:O-methyltransferase family protein [Westerdykella ornata]|uniref:O-methyltransferase family protein n=1 Tax=Westerdykella ornata TaxID=318751 RepID=A0A6A6JA35_WESOR|nr:O-methyltransferase family protein [Westerdykella ornata]KAF2272828.1 O-methyltransferase family protein [Westerdykella ornata]